MHERSAAGSVPVGGVVEITSGRIAGRRGDGVWAFAGIPYAAPPTGALRWRPPLAPLPWRGVRAAQEPGPAAPQSPPTPGTVLPGDPAERDEDCLTLNLWTPGLDNARRPVMVWVHGGGFTSGTGGSALYHGRRLALYGDTVVVTFNYRLGALGFLAHPALADPETRVVGNFGLLDQIAALRWVQEHVELFGGDPSNVTVFGESAGGMSVGCLMASPLARGLFRRAIIQSGPPYTHSRARAEEATQELVQRIDVAGISRDRLEAVPAEALVAATHDMQAQTPRPGELPLPFLPTVDGTILPEDPREAFGGGRAAGVELVIGTNRDEMAFFALGDRRFANIDEAGVARWLRRTAPEIDEHASIALYRDVRASRHEPVTPWHLWVAIGTDLAFRWPSIQLADAHRERQEATYLYLFMWAAPAFGGVLGSCHALEIPFVFAWHDHPAIRHVVGGDQPGAQELSTAMREAWSAFARGGSPSHPGIGDWSPWDPADRPTMVFDSGGRLEQKPRDEELEVLARTTGLPGPVVSPGSGDVALQGQETSRSKGT